MSALLEYLNEITSHGLSAIDKINEDFGIRVKSYDNGFFVFNYSQIDSPKTNPVVMESRGAILKLVDGEWTYFARPFKRFFNYGEAPDTLTDFKFDRSEIMEKADGSLIKVWHDGEDWQIATRGTAYAESENYTGEVFRDLVLDAVDKTIDEFQLVLSDWMPRGMTHMYEFISPDNRIVTPYNDSKLVYLGSVDNDTGEFILLDACIFDGMREAKTYYLGSIDDCVSAAKDLEGLSEGFVVRDLKSGQAVKIKSPLYVAAHHLRGELGLTPKKIAKLVVTNETDEYLKYFPEDEPKISIYMSQWHVIHSFIRNLWDIERINDIETQKEFAMRVISIPYSAVLFSARLKNEDPIKVLNSMPEKYKMDLLLKWMDK